MIGLKTSQAKELLAKHGYNELSQKQGKTRLQVLKEVTLNPIIIVMIVALLLTIASHLKSGDFTEAFVIFGLILLNITISYVQEMKTIVKLKSLEAMNEDTTRVYRDGILQTIKAKELVVGDIIELKLGDIARADVRVINCNSSEVDEAFLTGESEFVKKQVDDIIYNNSLLQNGHARCQVIATGMETAIGKITKQVEEVEVVKSQLEIKILDITKVLLKIAVILAVVIFVLSLLNGQTLSDSFSFLISILIATVPEGLATVLTIVLTFMASKLSSQNALIKQVNLLETLGELSYVCSDKTGTITENNMTVTEEFLFVTEIHEIDILRAIIDRETVTSEAISKYLDSNYADDNELVEILESIPFNSTQKKSSHKIKCNGKVYIAEIGAPDYVVNNKLVMSKVEAFASLGLRTILFALKVVDSDYMLDIENDLDLDPVILFGIQDPPKPAVIETISEFRGAGITPVMITGDNKITATSIARQTGIIRSENDIVLTHDVLKGMNDEELSQIVLDVKVYARAKPEDKVRIVSGLQNQNKIVAMMGDGTNDSIALRKANVGVAMGVQGTDISKEAADLILLDDNYQTISTAIHGGRLIFVNLRKFVRQMLTSNTAHTTTIMFALIYGLFTSGSLLLPMTPILILWINIISDAIPCLALGLDNEEGNLMTEKPIEHNQKILDLPMLIEILIRGSAIGLLVLITFNYAYSLTTSVEVARTLGFSVLSFGQLIHIFDARSINTIYRRNPFSNGTLLIAVLISILLNLMLIYSPLNAIFGLTEISFKILGITILISSIPTFLFSLVKVIIIKCRK